MAICIRNLRPWADIAIFDVASGTLFKELRGHAHPAQRVAFLPDGRLVSGGEERMVKLWDPTAGTCLASWVVAPADAEQHWDDQWVGVDASGNFVTSPKFDRLVGWLTGGDFLSEQKPPSGDDAWSDCFRRSRRLSRRVGALPLKMRTR